MAKMKTLLPLLEKVRKTHKVVLVYITEAHADDVWPLGFGINQAKNLDERIQNCTNFLAKWPEFASLLDTVLVDNMKDDFNKAAGVWPESYLFLDEFANCQWKSEIVGPDGNATTQHPHTTAEAILPELIEEHRIKMENQKAYEAEMKAA